MDEKEFDLVNKSNDISSDDSNLETRDGVNYETNDNWEFEAKAPTLDDELVLNNESERFEITFDDTVEKAVPKKDKKAENNKADISNGNAIMINKEPLKFIPVAIFVAAVIVVLAVLGVRYYTVPNGKEGKLMNPGSVVAVVDDEKISVGMYSYYYSSIVSYYEQYAGYGYYDLDPNEDYSTQFTTNDNGDTVSWGEFFRQEALEEIKNIIVYYNAGLEAGVTLTDTQKETIETQIKSVKDKAAENEVSVDQYIQATFGKYCTVDTLKLMLEQYYITANYKGMLNSSSQFTDKEIKDYFADHKDDFKQINFSYLAFEFNSADADSSEDSISKAKSYMPKMKDKDTVEELALEVYADFIKADAEAMLQENEELTEAEALESAAENYVSNTVATVNGTESPFDEEITNWLFSDESKIGETNIYKDESAGYIYVILKTEQPTLLDAETYTVRHILITPETDEEAQSGEEVEYTDEQMAQAKKQAEKILKEYESGEKTEYSFALLAEKYSADTASTSSGSSGMFGGLYEGVELGKMVENFEKWSTDKSRKYGDTGIVESNYGYHIMFFVNDCPQYEAGIISALRSEKSNAIVENVEVKLRQTVLDNVAKEYSKAKNNDASAETESSTAN